MKNTKTWGIVSGLVGIILGLILLAWPGQTLVTVIWLFGLFAIIYGFVELGAGIFAHIESGRRSWVIAGGIVSIILGALVVGWPEITGLLVIWLIAARALIVGVVELIAGFSGKKMGVMILVGLLNIVFGFILFAIPGASAVAFAWLIGLYLLLVGIAKVFSSFSSSERPKPEPV